MIIEKEVRCPYCGRCVAKLSSNDQTADVVIMKGVPKESKKKSFYTKSVCPRCRHDVVVYTSFSA